MSSSQIKEGFENHKKLYRCSSVENKITENHPDFTDQERESYFVKNRQRSVYMFDSKVGSYGK